MGSCFDEKLKREVIVYGKEGHHKKSHCLLIKRHEFALIDKTKFQILIDVLICFDRHLQYSK